MGKPRILLSAKSKTDNYIKAVEATGAVAHASYLPKASPEDYDGLILCGGGDIHPARYGEEIDGSFNIDEARDECEFALLDAFVKAGKPVLGICRGSQIINVYFGGSLIQHIDTAERHRGEADTVHEVVASSDFALRDIYGESFRVNSFHHQAVKRLGEGLKIILTSEDDGICEGFEHESLPICAFQFHPERMCLAKKREDAVNGIHIFEYFIGKCK